MKLPQQSQFLNLNALPLESLAIECTKYYPTVAARINRMLTEPFTNFNSEYLKAKRNLEASGGVFDEEGFDNLLSPAKRKAAIICIFYYTDEIVKHSTEPILSSEIAFATTEIMKETERPGEIKNALDNLTLQIILADNNTILPKAARTTSNKTLPPTQEELDTRIVKNYLDRFSKRNPYFQNKFNPNKEIFSANETLRTTRSISQNETLAAAISNSRNIENLNILLNQAVESIDALTNQLYYIFIQNYYSCSEKERIQVTLLIESVNTLTTAVGSSIRNQQNLKQSTFSPILNKTREFYLSLRDISISTNQKGLFVLEDLCNALKF
jgi:hypothetical protein